MKATILDKPARVHRRNCDIKAKALPLLRFYEKALKLLNFFYDTLKSVSW